MPLNILHTNWSASYFQILIYLRYRVVRITYIYRHEEGHNAARNEYVKSQN